MLETEKDGLDQLAQILQGRTNIDALHIFSHGSSSSLLLGSKTLSSSTINSYAATLSQIGSSLSPTGDILLYGCNVGAGAEGLAFVDVFAALTGVDVAASDDLTGSTALGGDWELEVESGVVESVVQPLEGLDRVLVDDYADDRTNATALTLGITKSGNIEVVSDQDYFKIDLVAGQRYLFEMTASGIGSLDAAYLYLRDSSGYIINNGYGLDLATFSYVATNSSTVYLEASELGDDSTGSYTVKASLVTTSDDYADDRTGATALTLGIAKSGNIEVVSDQDYFKIDLVAGQRYLFEMTASGIGSLDAAYLYLRDSSGYIINNGYGLDLATFSYVATNSSTVYLEASELGDDSTGSYTVKASIVNETHEPTGLVTITGTAIQNQTLTATNTLTDPDGPTTLNISYQWKANGVDILEATDSTLILSQTQVGQTISVTASYTDGQGAAESVVSAATTAVVNVNDVPTGTVNITGTTTQGQTLTATNNLADADGMGTVSYKWQADGVDINNATGSTLVLEKTYVGEKISVTASYTDGHNTNESVTSVTTGIVTPLDNKHDLTGNITFWKTGEALSDVHVNLMPTASTGTAHLIEFRNIELKADGSRTVEIWKTVSPSDCESLEFEIELQDGSTALWQTMLPSGWNTEIAQDTPKIFSLAAFGNALSLSSGEVQLGVLTLSEPTNQSLFTLSLADGMVGTEKAQPFTLSSTHTMSDASGNYSFTDLQESNYTIRAERENNVLNDAVTAEDALAALKMAVGSNPNSDGLAVQPYQFLAADVNHDGRVRATDALTILKMAVGLETAPESEWIFVAETDALATTMNRKAVDWSIAAMDITIDHDTEANLIGIVKGDVDGSWSAVR